MFKLPVVLTLVLYLLSFTNAFAYSTTVTGDSSSWENGILIDLAEASFWGKSESDGASDSTSGSFLVSSDYGNAGVLQADIMFNMNGFSNAIGINPSSDILVDFKITDHVTGDVVFSVFSNPSSQDDTGTWAYANTMSEVYPATVPHEFLLDVLYDWSLAVSVSAMATGEDDGMGGFVPPDISGSINSHASILFSSTDAPSATPVPSAVWLLGTGLVGLVGLRRSKKA